MPLRLLLPYEEHLMVEIGEEGRGGDSKGWYIEKKGSITLMMRTENDMIWIEQEEGATGEGADWVFRVGGEYGGG